MKRNFMEKAKRLIFGWEYPDIQIVEDQKLVTKLAAMHKKIDKNLKSDMQIAPANQKTEFPTQSGRLRWELRRFDMHAEGNNYAPRLDDFLKRVLDDNGKLVKILSYEDRQFATIVLNQLQKANRASFEEAAIYRKTYGKSPGR